MKGRPIEPGCLAMIIKVRFAKENIGRVVRVVCKAPEKYIPPDSPMQVPMLYMPEERGQCWIIEPLPGAPRLTGVLVDFQYMTVVGKYAASQLSTPESWLIRLDDDEDPAERDESREAAPRVTETHKPKTEEVF